MSQRPIALDMQSLFGRAGPFLAAEGDDGAAAGGGAAASEPGAGVSAPAGGDKGGDPKPLSLRESLEANAEIAEKGPESPDLSTAARTLAGARKVKAAPAADDAAVKAKTEAAAKEKSAAEAKTKREAELAAMPEEERKKAIAEDERKAAETAGATQAEAPTHWPAPAREMFAKQPPEVKTFLLERHKAMEADYTRKMQELAPIRRFNDELEEVFKPHDPYLRQSGMTRMQAIRELVGWKERLDKDAPGAIKYLAQISGVDLKTIGAPPADMPAWGQELQKQLEQSKNENAELRKRLDGADGARSQQLLSVQQAEVTKFAEEKDPQGKPLRPYFDDVAKDVAGMIRLARANGEQLTLQEAYDRAVHANPLTRQKLAASNDAERRAKEEAERKAKAEAARKAAAANIDGEGAVGVTAAQTGSVRASLEKNWPDGGRV